MSWDNSITAHPLQQLKGIGPKLVTKLEKLGIKQPSDLLFHLPYRYQDRTRITPIGNLAVGDSGVIVGRIMGVDIRIGRRRSLQIIVSDDTGPLLLRFFHFSRPQQKAFRQGAWIHCFGEVRWGAHGHEMVHPEYRLHQSAPKDVTEKSLTPIYPTTEGISSVSIRKLVDLAFGKELPHLAEVLPKPIQTQFGLMPIRSALQTAHYPPGDTDTQALMTGVHPALQRLAIEELLAHHLAFYLLRQRRAQLSAPAFRDQAVSWRRLKAQLSFQLTGAQLRVIREVFEDVAKAPPCKRLIQGDVGSGKTVVAAAAALLAIDNGYQVALMAPTELLAEQHRQTFVTWFSPLGITVEWLTGKRSGADRTKALSRISSGTVKMIVGTHALFQQDVEFARLGLIVIDEQHRFGVDQRLALSNKHVGTDLPPHQLIMSATPIPRSLAMIFYADLDVSNIDQLPPGRKSIRTVVVPDTRRDEIALRVQSVCQSGQQVYWVCPLIDESDKLQAQAATIICKRLQQMLSKLRITLVHGRMKSTEKEAIMEQFVEGQIDVLVATTVVEVGVDVPNASLMIIENAERLGLAQLHQLRGRVGRGHHQSACVLMYQSPLPQSAKDRLSIIRKVNDGFTIAQKDLEQRGPGELLGTRQTGVQQLKVANIVRDTHLYPLVEEIARQIKGRYPEATQPIIQRWMTDQIHYANV